MKKIGITVIQKMKFEYKIALGYFIFGFMWILLSCTFLDKIINEQILTKVHFLIGTFYVIVTSILLLYFIKRHINKLRNAELQVKKKSEEFEVQYEKYKEINIELQEAKEKAEENESKLEEAQSLAHIGSWELDLVNNKLTWSDEIYRIFGCKPQEFGATYDAFLNFIHPDDRDFVNNSYQNHINSKVPYDIVHRILLSNNEIKYVNERCKSDFDVQGKPLRSVGTVADITGKIVADEALLRTHHSIDSINDSIFWIDKSARVVFANQAACRNLEYSIEELLALKIFDFDPVFPQEKWDEHWQEIYLLGSFVMETVHRTKSGRQYPIELTTNKMEFGGIQYNCAIARDITERKKSEQELINAKVKAEENEKKFSAITNQASEGIALADLNGNYVYVNPALCKMTGYSEEELLKMSVFDLRANSQSSGVFIESKTKKEGIPLEVILKRKDESEFYTEIIGRVIKINNQDFILGTVRDITERRQAEEERKMHLYFLENMDKINKVIQKSTNLEQIMHDTMELVLSIFDCDRAFLLYPCDPETETWYVPMECTKLEYPGVLKLGAPMPISEDVAATYRVLLNSDSPVKFGTMSPYPLPEDVSERFGFKSLMSMAIYPKVDKPWQFGIHQCSHDRQWKPEEERLLKEIGRRLADALTGLLILRNLKESEQKYRSLAESIPDNIIRYDKSGRVIYMNGRIQETIRSKFEDLKSVFSSGRKRNQLADGVSDEYVKNLFDVLETGKEIEFEFSIPDLLPKREIHLVKMVPERNEFGAIIGALTISRDITIRKQTEEKLAKSEYRKTVQNRISNIFIAFPNNEMYYQVLNVLLEISRSQFGFFGIIDENEDLVIPSFTKNIWQNCNLEGKSAIFHHATFQNIIFGRAILEKKTIKSNGPFHLPNGHIELSNFIAIPILYQDHSIGLFTLANKTNGFSDEDQEILESISVFVSPILNAWLQRDLQEKIRRQTEEELIKAKVKAEESDRLKTAFLQNMSHEIRTPMNGILGFSELLKEPGLSGDQQQEYIGYIEKSGTRMLNIISEIVDISKIESGQMEVRIQKTNINKDFEDVYNILKVNAENKGINLSFKSSLQANEAHISTDREKLHSVLTNLVNNAIKYTDKGLVEFGCDKIDIDGKPCLQFFVKDTGIGIPGERQEAIFERFIQADIADKDARQGVGLGLSIAKACVEVLEGRIWVESEVGIGSTFYFTLPYKAESEGKIVDRNILPFGSGYNHLRNLKILIAEDDKTSEMLLSIYISEFDMKVIKARTGVETIEACRDNPDIDLILMDIQMPGINGYEATRQIRRFNKEAVIIAQTAFAQKGDYEKAIAAGCNDYISKPFSKDKLLKLIQRYFNQ